MTHAPKDELKILADWLEAGHRVALATVAATWGSAPRPVGSLLAVREDGAFEGSVSGGCVEAAVIGAAQEAIGEGQCRELTFGVSNEDAFAVGLACGGTIKIHIEPFQAPGEALDRAIARHTASPARLIIVGAVHIAQFLSEMAQMGGYDVTIVDPRTAFATPERFKNARLIPSWPEEAFAALQIDAQTAVVTLTHDPKLDDPALLAAVGSPAFYIAALGSRKTHTARLKRLAADGIDAFTLRRIEGPAGLTIGAVTPAEIALSIMAGITRARRQSRALKQKLQISAIVLAAGLSTRMAPQNKLLLLHNGMPMVRRSVLTVLESHPREVIVVTGHMAKEIEAALSGLPIRFIHNPDYRDGMGTSLAVGSRAVVPNCDSVLIALGDMPDILPGTLVKLIEAFDPSAGRSICVPAFEGQRGHPVLFDRMFLSALGQLSGDIGAKSILQVWADRVHEVASEDPGVLLDIDEAPIPLYKSAQL